MAAGSAALVVSAAKQTKVPFDAVRLKAALTGSARFIPRLATYEQGNGLVQVGAAYELLKKLQSITPVTIVSRAPIRTRLASLLPTPNVGVGLYEREGVDIYKIYEPATWRKIRQKLIDPSLPVPRRTALTCRDAGRAARCAGPGPW